MAARRILVILVVVGPVTLGAAGVWSTPAGANSAKPVISGLAATQAKVTTLYGRSTVSASVSNATSCSLSSTPAVLSGTGSVACSGGSLSQALVFPENTSTQNSVSYEIILRATGAGGKTSKKVIVRAAPGAGGVASSSLSGAKTVVSDGAGYCALLTSGRVDCWGAGQNGELGDGVFYTSGNGGSATPVAVTRVNGTGALTGVVSLAGDSDASPGSYCALLTSGRVDCWGYGYDGELGNGDFYTGGNEGSATPVAVKGVGGTGALTGVASLEGSGSGLGYCAVLTSGRVDCWGAGQNGELGDGVYDSSATPVAVKGVSGTGALKGVTSLASGGYTGDYGDGGGYCALLTSGRVDCWGYGYDGELGNGDFYTSGNEGSASPVAVKGVGGTGSLTHVASLVSGVDDASSGGYCALLTSGRVDCWGYGYDGELGNGDFYTSGNDGSATPVAVEGVGGRGALTRVASLASDGDGYCALLTSGSADCWGYGYDGELGDGVFGDSATPVAVEGVGGTGALTGVASLDSGANEGIPGGYCALLTSGSVDCWGAGYFGDLGNGVFYTTGNGGSATPVEVAAPS